MTDKKLKTKIKEFVQDRPDIVFAGVATTAAIGLYTFAHLNMKHAAKKAIEAQEEYAAMVGNFLDKADAQGKAVFELSDWTYLLVPKDVEVDWIRDITRF